MSVAMRDAWTDERMDDLSTRMDRGFDRVDADIRELRAQTDSGFERVDKRFERVDDEIRELRTEMNTRFDAMQRTLIIGFASIVASMIATQL
jgi:uncharacterized protein YdcH (DUF465 family)